VALDIFIPYWGDVNYMKLAVDSVLAQTSPDWRLTVVDDAYPGDDVRRYVEAADDPRITYIRKDKNEGITENFRTCVSLASQDVLVVMGCDDLLLPNFVDVVLRAHAEFPDAWIIQPGVQIIDEDGKPSVPLVDRAEPGPGSWAASGWRSASCTATGSTGPPWPSAATGSGTTTSVTVSRLSRISPSSWTWCLAGPNC
jgi:glycosyltransferase involved in cell wall biosynthesis